MRYWAYLNNQVCGPVEKEKLPELAGFILTSLICPETPAGGETVGWKEASTYPEVLAALGPAAAPAAAPAPAPAPQRAPAAESPLMMTMRGTIIDMAAAQPEAAPQPAPAPAPAQQRPAESPLMMTMRGTLIETPAAQEPAKPAGAAPAAQQAPPQPEPAAQKLEQISAMLASIANGQSQLLERLGRLENSVADMKSLLFPGAGK